MPPAPSSPPRVAHLLRPAAGGMRNQVRALLAASAGSALLAAPPDVLPALAGAVPDPDDRCALAVDGAPGAAAMLRAGVAAGQWARARGATLLHGHGLRLAPLFAAASLASGLPLVVTLHNLAPRAPGLPVRALLRTTLARARRVIAVARAVAHSAQGLIPDAARLVVVPNGVDVARYAEGALPGREAARAGLGLERGAPVALCLARLSPEKDVANFLEAAALAPLPGARFLAAGDGPLLPTLRYQIAFLGLEGRATLLGRRDDAPALLAAADLLCLPSREEGMSLAALEAMASGLPLVATGVGGLPEVVQDGETGLLVPPRDPPALARALASLLSDPARARAMGAAGRARAAACFPLDGMLRATYAVYEAAARR